ncbi:SMP-30/gluconolactonase/LRE family protein [Rheinheimera sp.]|uniref:SMP-30/gluconolactonase/LRE family protein n=1 Tax=Rheinheimera sp. TaxID=1869214 RepID=UPI0027B8D467|nr:SMP-30/gluconolactonase/LRE family protein [Rheinheimera sp.]
MLSSPFLSLLLVIVWMPAWAANPIPAQPVKVLQPELLKIIDKNARLEILAEGFRWAEGPVVEPQTGDLLFSDVPANKVHRYSAKTGLRTYLFPSGYTKTQAGNPGQGANGLIFNQQQQLVLAQHGDRALAVLDGIKQNKPVYKPLAQYYQGKKLNSPNDLVQHKDGSYYFTDPPYGLAQGDKDPHKEQTHNGIYRLAPDGTVFLLHSALSRPNGLAFSPDQKFLYVANSDPKAAQWWRFTLQADGSLGNAELFFDATALVQQVPGLPDGLKVLPSGHLLATGPGGVLIFNAQAEHLGTIQTGVAAANLALSADQQRLYITASNYLLSILLKPKSNQSALAGGF